MIKNDDNMPEWVQSKITLSQDYISTVRDYLQSKEELGEGKVYDPFTKKMVPTKPIKVQAGGGATRNGVPVETGPSKYKTLRQAYDAATAGQKVTPKQELKKEAYDHGPIDRDAKVGVGHKAAVLAGSGLDSGKHGTIVGSSKERTGDMWHIKTSSGDIVKMHKHRVAKLKEEAEQIDEVSKSTLMRYIPKASRDVADNVAMAKERQVTMAHATHAGNYDMAKKESGKSQISFKKAMQRLKGIDTATKKLGTQKEEVEQIDELSKGLVARYANKVAKTTQANYDKSKDKFQFSSNRQDGMKNAVKRLTKEETVEEQLYKQGRFVTGAGKKPFKAPTLASPKVEESKAHKVLNTFFKNREVAQRAFTGQNKTEKPKQEPEKQKVLESRKAEIIKDIMKKKKSDKFEPDPVISDTQSKSDQTV
jgi:Cu/Ag efflux protein CusF